jgi:hypothetical protein
MEATSGSLRSFIQRCWTCLTVGNICTVEQFQHIPSLLFNFLKTLEFMEKVQWVSVYSTTPV